MPTYITLVNWTEQGVKAINESPARLDRGNALLKEHGGKPLATYMTMGECDMVYIYEVPDDAAAARFTLTLAKGGSIRSKTLKAFPEAEYRQIVSSIK